eukprot:scaffold59141_cov37-Tisochrysis_lutea.AAC.1
MKDEGNPQPTSTPPLRALSWEHRARALGSRCPPQRVVTRPPPSALSPFLTLAINTDGHMHT